MAQTAPALRTGSTAAVEGTTTAPAVTSITIPSAVQVGDLMLLHVAGQDSAGAPTAPTGWTQLYSDNTGRFGMFWRRAVSGDPGSAVTLTGTDSCVAAQIESWVNVGGDPIVTSAVTEFSGAGTVSSGTVTTADANCTIVESFHYTSNVGGGLSFSSAPTVSGVPATAVQAATAGYGNVSGAGYAWAIQVCYQTQATAGVTTAQSCTFAQTGTITVNETSAVQIALPPIQAPSAPTLTAPANATYEDLSGTPTFAWTYNPTTNDGAQNAIAFRRKISGAPSYSYWNTSTSAWQSTLVWNSYTTGTLTFPAGAWANGNIYNWSVATQEATEDLQGPFASDFTVTAQAPPTVAISAPTGTIATTAPTVTAAITPAAGAVTSSYQVIVYTAAQVAAGGFSPGSGPYVYNSGAVPSTSNTISQPVTGLSNNVGYYAYVQATETGGETGAWASQAFTVSFDPPQQPAVAATAGTDPATGCPVINITVQGRDNLLSALDASFEGGLGTWTAGANTTAADSSAQALDGSSSMGLTATAAGAVSAQTASGASGYAVAAGETHTALVSFRAATTGRSATVAISWYTSSGTLISTAASTAVTDTTTGWTQAAVCAAAPANAAYASVQVTIAGCGASEVHYVDCAGLFPGTPTAWARGGLAGSTTVAVLRSDGLYVRGASAANPAAVPTPGQQVTVFDYEVVPGQPYTYTAVVSADIGVTVASPTSAPSGAVTVTGTQWWFWVPATPSTAVTAAVTAFAASSTEFSAAHKTIGATNLTIVTDTVGGTDGSLTVRTVDAGAYAAIKTLAASQTTVAISDPFGFLYYGRLGIQPGGMSAGAGNKTRAADLSPSSSANPVRDLNLVFVAQDRPAV